MSETAEVLLIPPHRLEALPRLTDPLVAWYRKSARELPWRQNTDPYRVWVSEIMLQQTRVEAVKGYYQRFMLALPTVAALADAEEGVLLKLWEGLGYYSRVRNLQRAARLVMGRHGGALPASYAELLSLPGIGEYTAGAVASIAFGIPAPAVDGNVYRVLSRVLGSYADTSRPQVKNAFRAAARSLLPDQRPGDLNQALMELGAVVCLPKGAPLCGSCPIAAQCAAREDGVAGELPVKAGKKPRRIEERTVLVVVSPRGVLLQRRGEAGLLAGLYQPLNLEGRQDRAEVEGYLEAMGAKPLRLLPLAEAKHIFTHVEWRMQGWLALCPPFDAGEGEWADREELAGRYAVPSAFRAYFRDMERYFRLLEELP